MNAFAQLLGPFIGQQVAEGAVPETTGNELFVDRIRVDPFRLENNTDIQARDLALESSEEAAEHKGMFGVKGTLRDVLGLVGDAFLVQGGGKAVYAPHRKQEQISDAAAGFTEDPVSAAERTAGIDLQTGYTLFQDHLNNQNKATTANTAQTRANTAASEAVRKTKAQARAEVSQTVAGALAVGTPEALLYAEGLARQAAETYGLTPEEVGLNEENLSPEQARVLAGRSATTNQNLSLPQRDRANDIREGSLNERIRNNKARAGIASRNASTASRRADIAAQREARQRDESNNDDDGNKSSSGPRSLRVGNREFKVTRQ